MFAVNVLGPKQGILESFKFTDEADAVEKQCELEVAGHRVEFVNLKYFPQRQKKKA